MTEREKASQTANILNAINNRAATVGLTPIQLNTFSAIAGSKSPISLTVIAHRIGKDSPHSVNRVAMKLLQYKKWIVLSIDADKNRYNEVYSATELGFENINYILNGVKEVPA